MGDGSQLGSSANAVRAPCLSLYAVMCFQVFWVVFRDVIVGKFTKPMVSFVLGLLSGYSFPGCCTVGKAYRGPAPNFSTLPM